MIEYCTELQCKPTVLFYERVDDPSELQQVRSLTIESQVIEQLYNKVNDVMADSDFGDG